MPIKHVLVVDDSKSARMILAKMLQSRNITVDLAESADEALVYLQDHRPDAIFMDHMMRGTDGLQATKIIKENPATALIPVAMYTSQDGEDYRNNVLAHGAIGLLAKPPTPEHLERVINLLNAALPAASAAPPVATSPAAAQPTPSAATPTPAPAPTPALNMAAVEKLVAKLIDERLMPLFEQQLPALEQRLNETLSAQIIAEQMPLLDKRLADTRDDIIAISQTNQDIALDQGLHRIVLPQLEERITELRKYIANNSQPSNADVLSPKMQNQIVSFVDRKIAEFAAQQQATIETIAAEAANKLLDSNLKKLYSRLSDQLNAKFGEFEGKLAEPRPIDPDSLKELLDKASAAATRKASETAAGLAEKAAAATAQQALMDIEEQLKAANKRLYMLSGVAGLVGVIAAAVFAAVL